MRSTPFSKKQPKVCESNWRHDIQDNDTLHNDTWHNDAQHKLTQGNGLNFDTERNVSAIFFIVMTNVIMVNVVMMSVLAPSNCPWLPNFILHDNQHFL
jgi:hypothetical protein